MDDMHTRAERYLDRPVTRVRRKDRALDDEEWIDRFLEMGAIGHFAVSWQGAPLLHSNLYWFDGERIYWHGAPVGKLRAVLDAGVPQLCFTVTEQGRVLPASTPFDFSTEYASVVIYGTVQVVADAEEKRHALEGIMGKYAPHLKPGIDYTPMPESDLALTSVYRLDIEQRVGKHNVKPANYPAHDYAGGSFIDAERAAGRVTTQPKELA